MEEYTEERSRQKVLSGDDLRRAEEYVRQLKEARMMPPSDREAEELKRRLDDFFLSPTNQYVLQWQMQPECTRLLQFFMSSVDSGLMHAMHEDVCRGYYSKRPLNDLERRVRRLEQELKEEEIERRSTTDVEKLLQIRRKRGKLISELGQLEREVRNTPRGLFAGSAKPSYNMFIEGTVLQFSE